MLSRAQQLAGETADDHFPATAPDTIATHGDSNTSASSADAGWRRVVDTLLLASGWDPIWVGPYASEEALPGLHHLRHNGLSGRRADELRTTIGAAVAAHPAAWHVVLIGTNDVTAGRTLAQVVADVVACWDEILLADPGAIVLSLGVPFANTTQFAAIGAGVNAALEAEAASRPRVYFRDVGPDLHPVTQMQDDVHFDLDGHDLIGGRVADFFDTVRRARGRRLGSRSTLVTEIPIPALDLHCDAAQYSGGLFTSLTTPGGQVFTATAGNAPLDGGAVANGHKAILFPDAGARIECTDAIAGPCDEWTIEVTFDADFSVGVNREEIIADIGTGGTVGTHLHLSHQGRGASVYDKLGHHVNGYVRHSTHAPVHGRQVVTVSQERNGTTHYLRNGVYLESVAGRPVDPVTFAYMAVGALRGSSLAHLFHGGLYRLRVWPGVALPVWQCLPGMLDRIAEFAIDAQAWVPPSSLRGWWDRRGKRPVISGGEWRGVDLTLWSDQSGGNRYLSLGVPGSYPQAGGRIGGHPTVGLTPTRWLGSPVSIGAYMTASAWEWLVRVRVLGVSQNVAPATAYNSGILVGDSAGYVWPIAFRNQGAVDAQGVPLYDVFSGGWAPPTPGAPVASCTAVDVSAVAQGQDVLIHAWSDGTLVHLRVGERPEVTAPITAVTNLNYPLMLGRRNAATGIAADVEAAMVHNAPLSTGDRAAARALMGAA